MGRFYVYLKDLTLENWFSLGIFAVSLLFVIYNHFSQDGRRHWSRPNVSGNYVRPSGNISRCSNPDCVRCRAKAKHKMHAEIHRRIEHMFRDVGELQLSQVDRISERLRNSFEQQLTSAPKRDVDDIGVTTLETSWGDTDESHIRSSATSVRESHLPLQNPSMFYLQQLSQKHIFSDLKDFPNYQELVSVIKSHFRDIRDEFDIVWNDFLDGSNMDGWQENTLPEGKWYTFHLMNQGKMQTCNMQRCPKTSKMFDTLEPLMTHCMFGFVTFSVVLPGSYIESHCGATNIRLRCHLGLHIPEDCCSLTVNEEVLHWKENECLLFDDSFLHEAEHHGNKNSNPRSVLMLDIWHPCLSSEEKNILKYVFHSDIVQ